LVGRTLVSGQGGAVPARAVAAKDPNAVSKILTAVRSYQDQREYSKAAAILERAVEEHALDADLRVEYARTLVSLQKYPEAYAQYEAALSLGAGESPGADPGSKPVSDPKLHFEAGTIASKAGLTARAEEHYSMAQSADPAEPKYPLYLAMVQLKEGKDDAATASLIRAVKLSPDMAEAWGTLAEISLKQNRLGLAAQHIEKARKLQPEVARWRLDEARVLKRQGGKADIEKAAGLILAMDKADRMKPEVMGVLAECYGLMHRPDDAAAMYAEASRARPTDGETAYQAAVWYERAGNKEESARFAGAAAALGHEGAVAMVKRDGDAGK
jgi:tetratricopeptide (TPR) repeat protein